MKLSCKHIVLFVKSNPISRKTRIMRYLSRVILLLSLRIFDLLRNLQLNYVVIKMFNFSVLKLLKFQDKTLNFGYCNLIIYIILKQLN